MFSQVHLSTNHVTGVDSCLCITPTQKFQCVQRLLDGRIKVVKEWGGRTGPAPEADPGTPSLPGLPGWVNSSCWNVLLCEGSSDAQSSSRLALKGAVTTLLLFIQCLEEEW
jgi:hypothetical protein